ncbi:MAG: hypothetical protein DI616_18485 [Paracoccus denitrificans]|uniref:Uncharacterized protein n=1 Tax=Paracoccus denitrificans TaxID=266 RepID=A0A533I392_PARDE|nr:MAG: hypothetical protein DI616_18485 [Paracoccus denitrificans]
MAFNPITRITDNRWLIRLNSRAFHVPAEHPPAAAWLVFHQPDLPGLLEEIAAERMWACRAAGHPLDGVSWQAAGYRHYLFLAERYRGLQDERRFAEFGPSSLRYPSPFFRAWDERFLNRDFLQFSCDECGLTGAPQQAVLNTWQSGEGRAMSWGEQIECPSCRTRIASRQTGANN